MIAVPARPDNSASRWPRPPSQDEQLALLRRAVNRSTRQIIDQGAFDELVVRNQPLVMSIAKRYMGRCRQLWFEDLAQVGTLGLMIAIRRFDERRAPALSTSATWWIRQSILRAIDDLDATVRLPVHMHTRLNRWWEQSQQSPPPVLVKPSTQPHGHAGMQPVDASILQTAQETRQVLSLEIPVASNLASEPSPLGALIADERANFEDAVIERLDRQMMLDKVIGAAQLSLREGYIVAYRMGIAAAAGGYAHSLEQVGERLGITRERVRQIEKNAICKLRKAALLVGYGDEFGVALVRHEYTTVQTRVDVVRVKKTSVKAGKKAS